VEAYFVAVVDPDPTPPESVQGDSWISVNLLEQTVAVYDHRQLVYATLASTGAPGRWTRPGLFQVVERLEHDDMEGASTRDASDAYFLDDVPWVLYFDGGRALHAAYWHNRYGFPHTHGCVNLAPVDAHWLYNWAEVGTWVYVWDVSGRTPTDLPR
jgi:lipoprotein-anchoring transpeptidase ErfK/SrfK